MTRRHTGKIGHMPKELRDMVNTMLRDGALYSAIISALEARGVQGVNGQNLTNWREGGHQEWLREQERLAEMQAKREFALDVVRENEGSPIHEAGLQIAASQIYELLEDFDVESLKEKLAEDPANFARIVNSLAKLSESGLKFRRYRDEVEAARKATEREVEAARNGGGMSQATYDRIAETLHLFPQKA